MVRHFLDLAQARVLPTDGLQLVEQAVADLSAAAALGVVHGPAGLGKTFAVEQALTGHPDAYWLTFPSRPTMRLVAATLFTELTGRDPGRASRFELMDHVIDALGQRRRVLVLDEAQRLNTECIEFLRHLHDHPHTRFTLVLVGGDGAWNVLSREPMLRSRVYRRIRLEALTAAQVCALMGSYHPIYDGVADELLLFIDDRFAHGNLRDWAAFTQTAAGLCARHGRATLDEQAARNTFALHGGGTGA